MKQVCSAVQLLFMSIAMSAIGSVVMNIESLSALGSMASLIGGILTIVSIYRLKHENRHFPKAIRAFWTYFGLSFVLVGAAVFMLVSVAEGDVSMIAAILSLALGVAVLALSLMMQYQIYAGLEELREVRRLDYPPRRILWCFYISIISIIVSIVTVFGVTALTVQGILGGDAAMQAAIDTLSMVGDIMLVFSTVLQAVHLFLLYTFMQSAKSALDSEFTGGW